MGREGRRAGRARLQRCAGGAESAAAGGGVNGHCDPGNGCSGWSEWGAACAMQAAGGGAAAAGGGATPAVGGAPEAAAAASGGVAEAG